jgi:large subunit ribosomal protein L9
MKVILKRDIKNVGRKDETKEVANGYAMNYLLPSGFARIYSEKAVKAAPKPKTNKPKKSTKKEIKKK